MASRAACQGNGNKQNHARLEKARPWMSRPTPDRSRRPSFAPKAVTAFLAVVLTIVVTAGAPSAARAQYTPTSGEFTQIAQFLAKGGAAPGTVNMQCGSDCQDLVTAQAALPATSRGSMIRRGLAELRTKVGELPKARVLGPVGLTAVTAWRVGSEANSKIFHFGVPSEEDPTWTQPTAHFCPDGCFLSRGVSVDPGEWYVQWYYQSSAAYGYQNTYVEETPEGCPVSIRPPIPPWPFKPKEGASQGCVQNPGQWPPIYGDNIGVGFTTDETGILQDAESEPWTGQPYDIWTQSWPDAPADGDEVIDETPDVVDGASGIEEELARDFIYSQFTSTVEDPQAVIDRMITVVDEHAEETRGNATGEEISENCSVPLWHYTSAANAPLIFGSQEMFTSPPVSDPPHPSGVFATDITPLDPGRTQAELTTYLGIASAKAWVLLCWDSGPNRAFRPEGTPHYWYMPGPYPGNKTVSVAAWGLNRMPAN